MSGPENLRVRPDSTLREVMKAIDSNFKGAAVVTDPDGRFVSIITDGDMRRAVLKGLSLETTVRDWAAGNPEHGNRRPLTAPVGAPAAELLRLMRAHDVRHLPLVDASGRVDGLAVLAELLGESGGPLSAVVMAGGYGKRLLPLTQDVPKPMLPVGDRPLMEHIVSQLKEAGIGRLLVATHYKAETIMEHFGDGTRFGMDIGYVKEAEPLGTAGALGLMERPKGTQLVLNGDVLTQVNFRSMQAFHRDNRASMTVGVRQFEFQVPFGVVETEGVAIRTLSEKPTLRFFVNAGIYLLEPEVYDHIRPKERLDMTELIQRLLGRGQRVVSFPISEYWLDVGAPESYRQAQRDAGGRE